MNTTSNENYFRGAAQAKVTQQGVGFSAGDVLGKGYSYHVKIVRNSVEKTDKGNLFLARMEVVSTNDPNSSPGDHREFKVWFSNRAAFANLRGYLHAILGYDEIADKAILSGNGVIQRHVEDLLQWVVGSDNPMEKVEVRLNTVLRQSKTLHAGQSEPSKYVFHTWNPVVMPTTAAVQAFALKAVGAIK